MIWQNETEFRKYVKDHYIDDLQDIEGKTVDFVVSYKDIIVFTDGTFISLIAIENYDGPEVEENCAESINIYDMHSMDVCSQDELRQMEKIFQRNRDKNYRNLEAKRLKEDAKKLGYTLTKTRKGKTK